MIILLGYKAKSGKDEVGKYLVKTHGFTRVAFADELKDLTMTVFGLTSKQVHGSLKDVVDKNYGVTPRKLLQDYGKEKRDIDEDFWSKKAGDKILKLRLQKNKNRFVITDLRFENELNYIRDKIGRALDLPVIAIKINRPNLDRKSVSNRDDISETALDNFENWDYVINNNKDIETLHKRVNNTLLKITKEI